MWPTMDMTAAVRVKARRAACHAAGSAQRTRNQRCRRGGRIASTLSSSCVRFLSCACVGMSGHKCDGGSNVTRSPAGCPAAPCAFCPAQVCSQLADTAAIAHLPGAALCLCLAHDLPSETIYHWAAEHAGTGWQHHHLPLHICMQWQRDCLSQVFGISHSSAHTWPHQSNHNTWPATAPTWYLCS